MAFVFQSTFIFLPLHTEESISLNMTKEETRATGRDRRLRVLHYIPSIDRSSGGVGAYMQLLAGELGRLVDLHVATHASDSELPMSACTLHHIAAAHPRDVATLFRRTRDDCRRLLRELQPDVVHVNTCWLPTCAVVQSVAQRAGYRVVLTPHGMLEPWIMHRHYWTRKLPAMLLYQRRAVKTADHIHSTAESERQNLLRLRLNDRITVVPNGIDVSNIATKTSWKRRKEILFLSRVHVKKGINYLIEAVATLQHEMHDYTIRIAGDGDKAYVDELKALAQRLGVSAMMRFEGGIYDERKWELFRNADLFVLPTHSENFGIVVAEALACGTPVITTKGAPWHELETYACGWWTDIGTQPTTNALRAFLAADTATLEAMGRRGRTLIEQHYSATAAATAMKTLYNNVIA